jgi:hypothetical protein
VKRLARPVAGLEEIPVPIVIFQVRERGTLVEIFFDRMISGLFK